VGLEAFAECGCAVKMRRSAARHSFLRSKCLIDQSRYLEAPVLTRLQRSVRRSSVLSSILPPTHQRRRRRQGSGGGSPSIPHLFSATMKDSRAPSNSDVAPTKTNVSFVSAFLSESRCRDIQRLCTTCPSCAIACQGGGGGGNHYSRSIGWRALNYSRRRLRRSFHHKHRG
jgi:hypothetical protein